MSQPDSNQGPSARVRVEDALSYLDRVKNIYANRPAIYAEFLDVMKEFKSESIDTPGVIQRVARLFRDDRDLIFGFNTFLPAGFKMSFSQNETSIIIQEPNGNERVLDFPRNDVPVPPVQEEEVNEELREGPGMFEDDGDEDESEDGEEEEYDDDDDDDEDRPVNEHVNVESAGSNDEEDGDEETIQDEEEDDDRESSEGGEDYIEKVREVMDDDERREEDIEDVMEMNERVEEEMEMIVEEEIRLGKKEEKEVEEEKRTEPYRFHPGALINIIKNRFVHSPSVFRGFVEMISFYQNKHCLEGDPIRRFGKTERNMMRGMGVLFRNHPDLVEQFRLFLPPDRLFQEEEEEDEVMEGRVEFEEKEISDDDDEKRNEEEERRKMARMERTLIMRRNFDIKQAIQTMTRADICLFEEMRRVMNDYEFRTCMRHLELYGRDIASKQDIMIAVSPIVSKWPRIHNNINAYLRHSTILDYEISQTRAALDIDYSACKLNGVSYRALPEIAERRKCSGRTRLCFEVLNDTWVSIPSWASEDSTVVSAKKTQFEEFLYRTEDERFELDIVIETNKYAMGCLVEMKHKFAKMSAAELNRYDFGDNWGVSSPAIFERSIRRVYGETAKAILDSLRREPKVGAETIYQTLKEKDEEWRDAQDGFNEGWKEAVEKHTHKSLDHQATQVKNADSKLLRPKNLIGQIESRYDESTSTREASKTSPHMILDYDLDNRSIIDAAHLIFHYMRRSALSKEEKRRAKNILRKFLPRFLYLDELPESDEEDGPSTSGATQESERKKKSLKISLETKYEKRMMSEIPSLNSCCYDVIYTGNVFYLFLRIHHVLCERLAKLRRVCDQLWEEQKLNEQMKANSASWNDMQRGLQKQRGNPSHAPSFDHVMHLVKSSLSGSIEPVHLEEEMRGMIPTHATMAFSIDKMVMAITRHLQTLASEGDKAKTLQLYNTYHQDEPIHSWESTPESSVREVEYMEKAKETMEGHNCYKIISYDREHTIVTIEMLEKEDAKNEKRKAKSMKKEAKKRGRSIKNCKKVPRSLNTLPHGIDTRLQPLNSPVAGEEELDDNSGSDEDKESEGSKRMRLAPHLPSITTPMERRLQSEWYL